MQKEEENIFSRWQLATNIYIWGSNGSLCETYPGQQNCNCEDHSVLLCNNLSMMFLLLIGRHAAILLTAWYTEEQCLSITNIRSFKYDDCDIDHFLVV